jgi:hypothetical protein
MAASLERRAGGSPIEHFFRIGERGSTVGSEVRAASPRSW